MKWDFFTGEMKFGPLGLRITTKNWEWNGIWAKARKWDFHPPTFLDHPNM